MVTTVTPLGNEPVVPATLPSPDEGGRCGVIQPIDAYQTGLRRLLA